jgi:hypothetical protein
MLVNISVFYDTLPGHQDCRRFRTQFGFNYSFNDSLKNEMYRHFPLTRHNVFYIYNTDKNWEAFREPIFDAPEINIGVFLINNHGYTLV